MVDNIDKVEGLENFELELIFFKNCGFNETKMDQNAKDKFLFDFISTANVTLQRLNALKFYGANLNCVFEENFSVMTRYVESNRILEDSIIKYL